MRPHHLYLAAIILLFVAGRPGTVLSQRPGTGFERISTEQGLSQGLINDILQDREGFIWVATKGGLNRYDGYSFRVFTSDPADTNTISSNAVSSLLEDKQGRIWIGTADGGINVYNKSTGRFLRIVQKPGDPSGLSGNRIEADIEELSDGRILVKPQGENIHLISLPDEGRPVISSLSLPGGRIAKWVFKDDKGNVWLDSDDNSIYVFNVATNNFDLLYDGQRFTNLLEKTGMFVTAKFSQALGISPIPDLRVPFIDSLGRLLNENISYGPNGELIMNGRFPIRTGRAGCNIYDFRSVKAGDNLKDAYTRSLGTLMRDHNIKCVLLDRSGVMWVGTMGHGIYKYRLQSRRFETRFSDISIQRLTAWKSDFIYVQGWRTARLLNGRGEETASPLESVMSVGLPFTNILQAKNGDYWLYWHNKISRYTTGMRLAAVYEELVNPASTEHLQPLIEDSRNRVWVCGANGTFARIDAADGNVSRFTIDIKKYTGSTGLIQTNAFYEDAQGNFWLGTEHGFGRLEFNENKAAPRVTWYKNIPGNSNSLSYNYVSWFTDDPVDSKYLWICTKGGGINRMDKQTGDFIHYTSKQGLPHDVVYGILTDNAGNLWGSTNRGLFCMIAGKYNELPVFRVFTTHDGLQDDEFNTNAAVRLSDGRLVFGGVRGLNIFDPKTVLEGNFSPKVFITGIQIANTSVMPGDKTGVLKETIEKTPAISLTHMQDVITLEFSSLDFTAPEQNKYRYQLVGIDKDWVESGNRRIATYMHLPAGNYVFKVQGSNSQGTWSEHIAELKIQVLPPWWRSWWAYIIYALLIVIAIRAWLKFNVNKAKLQSQLNFEQLEAKRIKELDTIKTQLYTNITHEFRTPLTVILGMAQQVMDKPNEQFESRMDMIIRNGRSLFNLVNEMLDLSKLETGKMQLQLSHSDVISFMRYVVESFQSLANSQQKQLHLLVDIDALYMEYDREKLRQIVSNLLSNAIKFTPEKGNIYITVLENVKANESDRATLVIKVKDTGIGIPEDQLQHVFDRFYQLDNSHTRKTEGTGIGLALTKELVKLMEGEITVKSPPAGAVKGSEFTVLLPLKKVAPVPDTIIHDFAGREATEVNVPAVSPIAETATHENGHAPLVLLVEDNADVVAYIASCLPEYRLAVGRDGREGFDIATDIIPDLIITDVMMPFVDGFEMVNQLRSNEYTSHIPVIMLTAKADMRSKIEGLQSGADVYLEKPFNKQELLVRIDKLLEMRMRLQQYYLRKAGIENTAVGQTVTEQLAVLTEESIKETKEDGFVEKVREAVEHNLADVNFTVEKLCKLVFMSHSQLHRKLDALTGLSPNKFIRMVRLKKAKELLQNPANSIAAVALDCGYADPGYFARVFKQEYGVTPQEYRGK